MLIAHRGDTNHFPENTIAAFSSAFHNGADGIELDVQERAGEMIVVHNYLYDKTKAYPNLEEVLTHFADKGRLEIEIKSLDLKFIEPLEKALKPYLGADIELTTSVSGLVSYMTTSFKDFLIGVIFRDLEFEDWMKEDDFNTTKIMKMMQLYKADIAHIPLRVVHPGLVKSLHQQGMKVHVHIHRQPMAKQVEIYRRLKQYMIDQSTFDDIDLLAELAKRGY